MPASPSSETTALDAVPERRRRGELLGAVAAVRTAVGREEDERVLRRRPPGDRAEPAVAARQLDQRGGSRGVVVRTRPDTAVVAVRENQDCVRCGTGDDGDEVAQTDAAEPGNRLVPRVLGCGEAVEGELSPSPRRLHRRRRPSRAHGRDSRGPAPSRAPSPRPRRTTGGSAGAGNGPGRPIVSASSSSGPSRSRAAAADERAVDRPVERAASDAPVAVSAAAGPLPAVGRLARVSLRPPRRGL